MPAPRSEGQVEPRAKSRQRSADTRLALLRAAECLFAARGVDAVSLREIAAAAGQGNHSAVAYHFRDKRELVNDLLARHSDPIQTGWLATLDHLSAEGRDNLPELVRLMVRSLAAKLDDSDGGPEYLLVVAQLATSRTFPLTSLPAVSAPGILELSARMMRHIGPLPSNLDIFRMLRVASVLYGSLANYQTLRESGLDVPREEFVEDLCQSLVALLRSGTTPAVP